MLIILGKNDVSLGKLYCNILFQICKFYFGINKFFCLQKTSPYYIKGSINIKILKRLGFALCNLL